MTFFLLVESVVLGAFCVVCWGGIVLQERCLLPGVFLLLFFLFCSGNFVFAVTLLCCWEVLSCWEFVLLFVFAFLFVGSAFCWELFVFAGSVVLLGLFVC